jgi:acetyltransferase-like isoleucine patch superfamily enzyme
MSIKLKNLIKRLIKRSRTIFFIPFLILSVIQFFLREILFGFDNACNYLAKISPVSIVIILRLRGARIGQNCDIQTGIVFHNCKDFKNFTVGDNCHIGKGCFFDLRNKIQIRSNVVISMRSNFITHIDMSKSKLREVYPAKSAAILIGDHVYIGVGSTLLMGSVIEEKAFVAANTLVTKTVKAKTLVAGSPAKFIKNNIEIS